VRRAVDLLRHGTLEAALMEPRVSVVIPTYNHARFVSEAIDSALRQTTPPHEVIVVDDGSTDDTRARLIDHGDAVLPIFQTNAGVAVARNAGVARATGDLLAFLDADDTWLPTKLEQQLECILENPSLGLVHCGLEYTDGSGRRLARVLDGAAGRIASDMLLFSSTTVLGTGSSALIPRDVFEGLDHGFDPRLPAAEDWDLAYRIAREYEVGFVPEALVRYRLHDANRHNDARAFARGVLRTFDKAFQDPDPAVQRIRRRAYANVHMAVAATFLRARSPREFLRHGFESVLYRPAKIAHLMGLPCRALARRRRNVPKQLAGLPMTDLG
jgi:glycosyltransferase involved in cell wall biosynthesis